jgi:putative DNA primase/helicase
MAKKGRHQRKDDPPTGLGVALLYASGGLPIVPLHGLSNGCCTCGNRHCERPGRHPRADIAGASLDPEKIKRMWKKWPKAKIAIAMGGPGKLVALKTYGQTGRQNLRAITARDRKLRETVTIRDRDRRIYLFRVHGIQPRSREIADGVRILGSGKFIVAPSNLTRSTNDRRFAKGRAPGEVTIPPAPQWLLQICETGDSDRSACDSQEHVVRSEPGGLPSNDRDGDSRLVLTSAADVVRKDVEWLWSGRIALGKLSVIAGDPGLGKSLLAAFLAATVSTGREWPCGEGRAPRGRVIMLMAEDDANDTIVPRLEVANADLSRVRFVDDINHDFDLLSEIKTLEQEIRRFGDVRLVIIDPITAFLKSTSVQRGVATRLQQLAAGSNTAIVVVSHMAKTARTSALNQVTGSLGLVAVARAVFIVAREQGTDRRLFLPAKNNLAGPRGGLAYRIEPRIAPNGATQSVVVWDSAPVTVSAQEALVPAAGRTKQQPALTDAVDFLRLMLSSGPLAAKDIMREAREAGVSIASLRRATGTLKVKKRRVGGLGGEGHWVWDLPDSSATGEGGTRALTEVPFQGG